ncbi:MAG: hypothetical protein ACLSDQ_02430 [Adlercreutzia equolifaciens]
MEHETMQREGRPASITRRSLKWTGLATVGTAAPDHGLRRVQRDRLADTGTEEDAGTWVPAAAGPTAAQRLQQGPSEERRGGAHGHRPVPHRHPDCPQMCACARGRCCAA